ncbi:MAG TPA: DUF6788 family protein [Vicinamibacteria bacterium]|nr:DUF6788 family protein [Vicinamibacteria bacterium]
MTDPEAIRKRVLGHLAEQRALVERLLALKEQLQGSLFARYQECRKEGCACSRGEKHGPYYVLSSRSGGKGSYAYLGEQDVPTAQDLVARSKAFRDGLRRLQKVNAELVRLLKDYQSASAQRGVRRLGLPVRA